MPTKTAAANSSTMPGGTTADARTGDVVSGTVASSPGIVIRRRLAVALIALGWCAVLGGLVLTSANPITLNRRQILDADAVVTVQVGNPATGTCQIVKQWSGTALPEEIVVEQLNETAVKQAGDWILPLLKTADGWEVVPNRLPSGARFVYPATTEAIGQLEEILNATE